MQRLRSKQVSICGLAALLAIASTHRAQGRATIAEADLPVLSVPRLDAPPTIDGAIDPDEWKGALAVSGVVDIMERRRNILLPRPTTFYLGWDAERLYVAYRVYLPANVRPNIRGRGPRQATTFCDGAEMVFVPSDRNRNMTPEAHGAAFKFNLNALGFSGDTQKIVYGQQFGWTPEFETGARVTAPGTAPNGGSWLEVEMAARPEDFDLKGPHQAGDEWRMMLGMNHMPVWLQVRIPSIGDFFQADGAGYTRVRLVENIPAVQFTMDSLENLSSDGTAAMKIAVHNPTREAHEVTVAIDVAETITRRETLNLAAGESGEVTLHEKLPEAVQEGVLRVNVTTGEQPLLAYTAPFKVNVAEWITNYMLNPPPPKSGDVFPFSIAFNPVRGWLLVRGDTYALEKPETAASLRYRVYPEGNDTRILAEGVATNVVEYYFQSLVKMADLAPGKYVAEAVMTLADGRELTSEKQAFEKQDEARAFSAWWGSNYGNIEQVLPPFEAIREVKGSRSGWFRKSPPRFSAWGREYELTALGLPSALISQGEDVLAEPARLVVVVDGQDIPVDLGRARIVSTQDWRVEFEGAAAGAGLTFSATGWLEQDGLVYVELTYAPGGTRPVSIDAMRIEYPLAGRDADNLVCIGAGGNFSAHTAIQLPDTEGRLWSTFDTGRGRSYMRVGSFYPQVWVGSERRGFLWWADNDQGWFPVDEVPAHEAIRQDGTVILRNNIISQPVELSQARTIRFSYNGTPFRPFTKGWRMVGATENGTFEVPHRARRVDAKGVTVGGGQQNWIHPNSTCMDEWDEIYARWKGNSDARIERYRWRDPYTSRAGYHYGNLSFAFHGYGAKSIFMDVHRYFGPEWGDRETWNPTLVDYAMWMFDQTFSKGGIVHTYWDITFPMQFEHLLSGLAYELPDGRAQPSFNGWNQRRFFMRLQALAVQYGLFPNAVGAHSTNAYMLPAMPWIDSVLDGERGWDVSLSKDTWVNYYPKERMRAMSMPHNWGVPICWMAIFDGNREDVNRNARIQAEWIWMHDSWRNPYVRAGDLKEMPARVLDYGLNEEGVAYYPYWRNPYVESSDPDVLVSLWRLPAAGEAGRSDRVILGVFNYNRDARKTASLKIDLDALGLVPELVWQEFVREHVLYAGDEGGASLNFNGRTLQVRDLAPHRLRLIGIRRY